VARDRAAPAAGHGCLHARPALHRAHQQRRLSWLCYPGRLGRPPGLRKGAWRPHWEALFDPLAGSVPADWTVLVMADRGLYARGLFQHLVKRGWHPFLRINLGGNVRPQHAATFRPLATLVPRVGSTWSGRVTCLSGQQSQLDCTLLARWDVGYTEAWLIVTDLAEQAAEAAWYGMRTWIEGGFKDIKRGGWQWQQTKMTDPARDALVVGDRRSDLVGGECGRRSGRAVADK
jgi:hypothetical protein